MAYTYFKRYFIVLVRTGDAVTYVPPIVYVAHSVELYIVL